MIWDSQIVRASFRGVEFDCQTTDDTLERRVAEYEFPWRDGVDTEDLGRKGRATTLKAVFIGDNYLDELEELMLAIDSGETGEFVHPLLGSWTARVKKLGVHHTHDNRDGAEVDLEVIEDGTNTALPDLPSVDALVFEVYTYSDLAYSENVTAIIEAYDAVTAAQDFADDIKNSVNRAADKLNEVRRKIDKAVAAAKQLTDVNSWPLVRALKKTAHSCHKLAKTVQSMKPSKIKKRVAAALPVQLMAHTLYGDATRMDEMLELNKVRNPFSIPAGTEMKVYSK